MTGHFEESDLSADLKEAGVVVVYKPFSLGALYRQLTSPGAAKRSAEATASVRLTSLSQAMSPMMEDRLIADAVAVISSVDPIMGEVDR